MCVLNVRCLTAHMELIGNVDPWTSFFRKGAAISLLRMEGKWICVHEHSDLLLSSHFCSDVLEYVSHGKLTHPLV